MCRNIKILYSKEQPATEQDIQACAVQFVKKVSGAKRPSKNNQDAFDLAVTEVSKSVEKLFKQLQ